MHCTLHPSVTRGPVALSDYDPAGCESQMVLVVRTVTHVDMSPLLLAFIKTHYICMYCCVGVVYVCTYLREAFSCRDLGREELDWRT